MRNIGVNRRNVKTDKKSISCSSLLIKCVVSFSEGCISPSAERILILTSGEQTKLILF